MSRAAVITNEHMERAYAQLRKPGWPTLAELTRCSGLFGCVLGRARGIAEGRPLPPEPAAVPPPPAAAPAPIPEERRRAAPSPLRPVQFSPSAARAGDYLREGEL